ncbi:MAG: L,D-transpeptidase [Actinomycetota bacterium]|nr:L,D-transpeptidase [Actinomycetota bacterium]
MVAQAVADLPPTTLLVARAHHVVRFHARPGGKLLFRVLPRTLYRHRLVLSVTQRRGAWAAVPTWLLPNGRRAWVRMSRRTFSERRTRWRLRADLSDRTLTATHAGAVVRTLRIAIGTTATPTPTGTFAVTDKVDGHGYGASYGCCILALTGHQPRVRTGSVDGRLAIHGTNAPRRVGTRASQGCLRAVDADVRWLRRHVPVGTQLTIVP